MSLSDRELQSLRNQANECEDAADEIVCLRERIRVLREALEKTMNYASCDYSSSFRPHFEHVMKQARAALEATK